MYFKNKEIVIKNRSISDIIDMTFKELQKFSVNNISAGLNKNLPDELLKNPNNNDTYDFLIFFVKETVINSRYEQVFNPYPFIFNSLNKHNKNGIY